MPTVTTEPGPPPTRRRRFRRTLLAGLAVLGVTGAVATGTSATAAVGSDDFRAGQVYRGDFPDPSIMRVGSTYYAFSTNTGGKLIPEMTSTDLHTWRARYSNTGKWWQNDALAKAPSWAKAHRGHGAWRVSTWAPSVKQVDGGYVAAYAAPISISPEKMCVTLAYSTHPTGPFVDSSRAPFVCRSDSQGSIDPYIYKNRYGTPYLIWKNEGIPRREPTRFWIQRMNRTATAFAPGSRAHNILTTASPWEGNLIENPAMIRVHGRIYVFYSANSYATSRYAIGYALCRTPLGPCKRPASTPLIATGGSVSGPGGPDPFLDQEGNLRLAYAAWSYGRVGYPTSTKCEGTARGCNQRRLHVATLAMQIDLKLKVTDRG